MLGLVRVTCVLCGIVCVYTVQWLCICGSRYTHMCVCRLVCLGYSGVCDWQMCVCARGQCVSVWQLLHSLCNLGFCCCDSCSILVLHHDISHISLYFYIPPSFPPLSPVLSFFVLSRFCNPQSLGVLINNTSGKWTLGSLLHTLYHTFWHFTYKMPECCFKVVTINLRTGRKKKRKMFYS